jgi:hypothetical protein
LIRESGGGFRSPGEFDRRLALDLDRGGSALGGYVLYNIGAQIVVEDAKAGRLRPYVGFSANALSLTRDSIVEALRRIGLDAGVLERHSSITSSLAGRLDLAPTDRRTVSLIAAASRASRPAVFSSPFRFGSGSPEIVTHTVLSELNVGQRIAGPLLSEFRVGVSSTRRSLSRVTRLPAGAVLADPTEITNTSSPVWFYFGESSVTGSTSGHTVDGTLNLVWASRPSSHRLKLSLGLLRDVAVQDPPILPQGRFTFRTVDALIGNRPDEFEKVLAKPTKRADAVSGFGSFGDVWRHGNVVVQGGVRAQWDYVGKRAKVASPTDLQLMRAPFFSFLLDPRIGIQWGFGRDERVASRARQRWTVRMVAGRYSSSFRADPLVAFDSRALPMRMLRCVSDAAPPAAWESYLEGLPTPTACTGPAELVDSTSASMALEARYRPSSAARASAAIDGRAGAIAFELEVTASQTSHISSALAASLRRMPVFRLTGEASRPVFVPVSGIDEETGVIASRESREVSTTGDLVTLTSDLRSHAYVVRASLRPNRSFRGRISWSIDYVWTRGAEQLRGLDGNTGDDPRAAEVAPLRVADHRARGRIQWMARPDLAIVVSGDWQSGVRYSALVDGDVNGDGISGNDRAYVPDGQEPTHGGPGPFPVPKCLVASRGTIAPRNACRGPGTWSSGTTLSYSPPFKGRFAGATGFLQVQGLLAGADLLLHGSKKLRGWEGKNSPDPIFLTVRGFDRETRQFKYVRNPGFGRPLTPRTNAFSGPRVALGVVVPLAPPPSRQSFSAILQLVGRGTLQTAEASGQFRDPAPNPFLPILAGRDSLLLDDRQFERLETALHTYREQVAASTKELLHAGELSGWSESAMLAVARAKVRRDFDSLEAALGVIRDTLDGAQFDQLPRQVRQLFDPWVLAQMRESAVRAFY